MCVIVCLSFVMNWVVTPAGTDSSSPGPLIHTVYILFYIYVINDCCLLGLEVADLPFSFAHKEPAAELPARTTLIRRSCFLSFFLSIKGLQHMPTFFHFDFIIVFGTINGKIKRRKKKSFQGLSVMWSSVSCRGL